jgi:hypothetical protein
MLVSTEKLGIYTSEKMTHMYILRREMAQVRELGVCLHIQEENHCQPLYSVRKSLRVYNHKHKHLGEKKP